MVVNRANFQLVSMWILSLIFRKLKLITKQSEGREKQRKYEAAVDFANGGPQARKKKIQSMRQLLGT